MIRIEYVYWLTGALFGVWALLGLRDASNPKRWANALFYGLLAVSFLFGSYLGNLANGLLVVALALIAGFIGLGRGREDTTSAEQRAENARRHGDWLFLPALVISAVAIVCALVLKDLPVGGQPLIEAAKATVVSLAIGVVVATLIAVLWLRPRPAVPLQEGRRLIDTIGWAAILPQALASLGAVFLLTGVGEQVGGLMTAWLPLGAPFAAVAAYTVGMALFTIIMGNAFAAFPIMTAAIGLPLIVKTFHGDPVIMGAIGMLSGFCGTLMTPMAANFNVVPATLLELPDRNAALNGVIRAQIPTAAALLLANTLLMYFLVFRF
jgi:uncharacterized membrane protein